MSEAENVGQEAHEVVKEDNKITDEILETKGDATVEAQETEETIDTSDEKPEKSLTDIMTSLDSKEELPSYSSDECEVDSDLSDSSSSSESEEESESEDDADGANGANGAEMHADDDEDDDDQNGPIHSKNEILDEIAPTLPQDFKIDENAPLQLVGEVISAVEKSVIVRANISGEFRILKENSVLCFEDRQVLGPLFEVFGRLQSPFYRVKFNSDSELDKFKSKIGFKVFYVVPDSEFVYTDAIKAIKGTDASNYNDEELPEEEQEFSDDEKEAASKSKKKNKKKKSNTNAVPNNKRLAPDSLTANTKKAAQYKPIYSNYKSVNESTSDVTNSDAASGIPNAVQNAAPVTAPKTAPKPQVDPQAEMLKLQLQFMQIHNNNSRKLHDEPNYNLRGLNQTNQIQSTTQQPFHGQQYQYQYPTNATYQPPHQPHQPHQPLVQQPPNFVNHQQHPQFLPPQPVAPQFTPYSNMQPYGQPQAPPQGSYGSPYQGQYNTGYNPQIQQQYLYPPLQPYQQTQAQQVYPQQQYAQFQGNTDQNTQNRNDGDDVVDY